MLLVWFLNSLGFHNNSMNPLPSGWGFIVSASYLYDMTLLVDKSLSTVRLILTATESLNEFGDVELRLVNEATNVGHVISLHEDISLFPDRYNEFNEPIEAFSGLSVGVYTYQLYSSENQILETGLLRVVDSIQTPQEEMASTYTYITPADTDDDFIIYQP